MHENINKTEQIYGKKHWLCNPMKVQGDVRTCCEHSISISDSSYMKHWLVLCWKSWNCSIQCSAWQASEGNLPVLYMNFSFSTALLSRVLKIKGFLVSSFLLMPMAPNHLSLPMAATATVKKTCGKNTNSLNIFFAFFLDTCQECNI